MRFYIGLAHPCTIAPTRFECFNCTLTTTTTTTTTSRQPLKRIVDQNQRIGHNWETFFDPIHQDQNSNYKPFSKPAMKKLGNKWKEYQGITNWEGLLDPLDDNLRGEILRYGDFVEAAYKSFEFEPSSPSYATCRYPKSTLLERSGLSRTGYKPTKHLRATSGIQLPRWVDKAPNWMGTQSSWIGYVAVCNDKDEIARLGRRDVVIAYRGTATCLEWLENLRATLTELPDSNSCNNNTTCDLDNMSQSQSFGTSSIFEMIQRRSAWSLFDENKPNLRNDNTMTPPMVESGFLSLYTSRNGGCQSLQEMVQEEISRLLKTYKEEPLSLTITGHSLGAALATLTAYDIKTTFKRAPLVTVISFGGPRVGNRSFRQCLERQGTKVLRIVNSDDLITKVPGFVMDDDDDDDHYEDNLIANDKKNTINISSSMPSWIQKRVEDTQWVYAEIGRELRLSSKDSPYLNGFNVATCHDLKTYLHLVSGFVSSSCPFRAAARDILNGYE